ncbi:MAG: hypothetical protein DLM69_07910 [Candidatus Chloroheliales bacterium]|nr:MAG: hypothetical protein DLM69_07910 [Chloroflexota bacterium]
MGNIVTHKRIFVVDKTSETRQLHSEILRGAGYEVTIQGYVSGIPAQVRQMQPHLIILLYSPANEHQGWMTLQMLKMSKDLSVIPVIICIAPSERVRDMDGQLLRKGVTVLFEPFSADQLLGIVKATIG